jgi:hypothetical protein
MGGERVSVRPKWHPLLGALSLLGLCLLSGQSSATGTVPVIVTMLGPGTVRVRVAEGTSRPCDSGDDRIIVEGKYAPGTVIRTATTFTCVCVQQTYESFPDIDWSLGGVACRDQVCTGYGKAKRCVETPHPSIRAAISSKRPE